MRVLIIIFILLSVTKTALAQSDSIIVETGPGSKRELNRVLVINGFLISDTAVAKLFLKKFSNIISDRKFYSSKKGFKIWGIKSQDGILFCRTKEDIIINIESMKVIYKKPS